LKIEKDNAEAYYNVAKLYRAMGKTYRAQYFAEKSVELSKNEPDYVKPAHIVFECGRSNDFGYHARAIL
jgi:hypothetical protein